MSMRVLQDLGVERCKDGYLQNAEDWNKDMVFKLASEWKGMEVKDEHFPVLEFIRAFHEEHQVTPDVRDTTKFLMQNGLDKKEAKKYLFKLFPNGYMQQGVQLAGMRRPTAWCVG
jgi:tRNA 2-thiouridine synthesizing protein E